MGERLFSENPIPQEYPTMAERCDGEREVFRAGSEGRDDGVFPIGLVLIGAAADGKKELIGIVHGYRESEQSWKALK